MAESALVPACVGVDLQLKMRSQPQASCGQALRCLVQRLLRPLQQRIQLVVLETRIESTIQTSSDIS